MGKSKIECSDILDLLGGDSFCCMLEAGHEGPHRDEFEHEGKSVIIEWRDADNSTATIADDERGSFPRQPETPSSEVV